MNKRIQIGRFQSGLRAFALAIAAGLDVDRKDFSVNLDFATTAGKSGTRERAMMLGVSVPLR